MSIEVSPRVRVLLERLTSARASKLDNLDVLVSSRAPASTALSNAVWTDARAAKLDNLDTTVSSRATNDGVWTYSTRNLTNPSTRSALTNMAVDLVTAAEAPSGFRSVWTDARAAKLDYLDASITSRASAADYTSARAAKLDNLDATISSRATNDGVWTYSTRNLTNPSSRSALTNMAVDLVTAAEAPSGFRSVWTDARAAKLDNLDATISSRASAADYTSARAAKLDYLDAAITSRASAADYTSTRAAYLDNLISIETASTYNHPSGTTESDAVVITPAELSKYDKLCLDLNALTQTTYIRTYVKVDGTNYRLADYAEFPADFPSGTKTIVIDLMATAKAIKVTLQSAVAEGATRAIPYFYVRKSEA